MSNAPYSTVYSPLNPSFINFSLTDFLTSSGTAPTATGYCLYQKQGNLIIVQFQYTFVTVGTGNYRLNLPVQLSTQYPKPQGFFNVRYASATGKVHLGYFNDNSGTSTINMVAQATFGSAPTAFTSAHPDTGLAAGDVVSGEIRYVTV